MSEPFFCEADENASAALSAFLNAVSQPEAIERVYTSSTHATLVRAMMNACLQERPEWKNTIQMLSVYPVQMWAAETRRALHIDTTAIDTAIAEGGNYFGINAARSMRNQQAVLDVTDEALALIESAVAGDYVDLGKNLAVFQAVHDSHSPDVSKYLLQARYPQALVAVCEAVAGEINDILSPIESLYVAADDDLRIAYHDADLLIRMGPLLLDEQYRRHTDVNYKETCASISQCITSLKSYPANGREIHSVVEKTFFGWKETDIANALGRSRTYIRAKYQLGAEAVAYLVWGYATQQIIGIE